MATSEKFERMLLTPEGRSRIADTAEKLVAKPPSGPKPTGPVPYKTIEAGMVRKATQNELRYAGQRSGVPLVAPPALIPYGGWGVKFVPGLA